MERKLGNNTKKAICLQLVLGSLLILPINFCPVGEAAGVTINVPDQTTYNNLGLEYRDANDNVVSATSFSGNTVTIGISGTTAGPTIYGGVYGGKSKDTADNNTVYFYGGTTYDTNSVNGGYVSGATGSASVSGNTINLINYTPTIVSPFSLKNYASGSSSVTGNNNTITVENSDFGKLYGNGFITNAFSGDSVTASGNVINITKGSTVTTSNECISNIGRGNNSAVVEKNSIAVSDSTVTAQGAGIANTVSAKTATLTDNSITLTESTLTVNGNGINNLADGTTVTVNNNSITSTNSSFDVTGIRNCVYGVTASLKGNAITVSGGTITTTGTGVGNFGYTNGDTSSSTMTDNNITLTNAAVTDNGWGIINYGSGKTVNLTGNNINITGGTTTATGQGIVNYGQGTTVSLNSNAITIKGNKLTAQCLQNYSYGTNSTVTGNIISLEDSTALIRGAGIMNSTNYSDETGTAENNIINILNSNVTVEHTSIFNGGIGRNSAQGNDNTINIFNSTVTCKHGNIYNYSYSAYASQACNNTVNIENSNISGNVMAGYAETDSDTAVLHADDNTMNITGATNNLTAAKLYGGVEERNNTPTFIMGSNNTLNMYSKDVTAADVGYFNNYNFYLPTGTQAGDTMLTVTKADGTNLTGASVDIKGVTDDFALTTGEKVNLIKNTNGVTVDAAQPTTATVLRDISTVYDFVLDHDANSLYATVKHVGASEQTKAFMESRLGVSMFVNKGANLIGDNEILDSLAPERKYEGITVMNYGKEKATTGSSVEAKGLSMLLGFGKAVENGKGTLRWAPFIEAGWGSYDAENEFLDSAAVHGNGNTDYYGLGFMARQTAKNGNYLEGSVRAGRVSDDYTSDLSYNGKDAEYDITTTYYGAHVGIGKVMEHDKYDLDVFAKYFYNKVKGDDVHIFSSDYTFDDTSSNRLKAGFKYTGKLSKNNNWFGGLAWEYEMSGSQEGTVNSYDIASPDYKGHSGVVTAGYTYTPDDKKYDANFSLSEHFGKRHGISARVECRLKF